MLIGIHIRLIEIKISLEKRSEFVLEEIVAEIKNRFDEVVIVFPKIKSRF